MKVTGYGYHCNGILTFEVVAVLVSAIVR